MGNSSSTKKTSSTSQPARSNPVVQPPQNPPQNPINFQISSKSDCGTFSKVPKELLFEIARNLSDIDLLSLSLTCHAFHTLISEDALWLDIIKTKNFLDPFKDSKLCPKAKHFYFQQLKLEAQLQARISRNEYDITIKGIIFVGSQSVGKSTLVRVLAGEAFNPKYDPTFGVDYASKSWVNAQRQLCKAQMWDTSGNPAYQTILTSYYRGATVLILVYSVTNKQSLADLEQYLQDVSKYGNQPVKIVVATHNDTTENEHQLTSEEGQLWATERNSLFVEVSCKTRQGMAELKKLILENAPVAQLLGRTMTD